MFRESLWPPVEMKRSLVQASEEAYRLLDLPLTHYPLRLADVLERVHPADRDRITRATTEVEGDMQYEVTKGTVELVLVGRAHYQTLHARPLAA